MLPVLVVGCGPVGATLALILARRGVRVMVIDRAEGIYPLPRAIAFDSDAFRILQAAGIGSADFDHVQVPRIRLISPWFGVLGDVDARQQRDTYPVQSTFHQPGLEEELRRRLRAMPGLVDLQTKTELLDYTEDAGAITARLGGARGTYEVRARFLVGCDGAHSIVRRQAGIGFDGRSYHNDWLVIDAENPPGGIDHVEFLCDPSRPTPHMVSPAGGQRWEFMLRPDETRQQMESDDAIDRLLTPWGGLARNRIHRRAVYRFHARSASAYRKGRVMIAGDAAHVTPPFVGQGLISGLRDCHNLGWKLAAVVQGRAGHHILDSYDAERRPHARTMIDFARHIGALIAPQNRVSGFALHGAAWLLRQLPPLRRYVDRMGMRPSGRFRRGLFLRSRRGKTRAGNTFPQFWITDADGARLRSDDVLGTGFALVGYGVDPLAALDPQGRLAAARLGAAPLTVLPAGAATNGGVIDTENLLCDLLLPATVLLLRPDRVVAGICAVDDASAMLRRAERLLTEERRA
ncbi:MAG: bifunctional 3-(3-hydroxy-phenyl)propionate/3-hydroxycinnamic acid hydroxylase [Paracoccus sp. (in: a-proteobacteria)]|uniref:bifunctional 3-(3-hydroxy-phenyl)propionate/3-hydroxycinnamic acid hydroxylase n=1 Tax=Paracoccus sp. TaxID=267 RepID=UPI0026DFCA33|nr:bifunctional 3-(3-hydroxy-phenyl)propionate/3-hydroxycinnamic acid hydroxylase [Paracoccus sp. (in: a-proteobacteria)]MDO5633054.1 bifunctional 3-(3-hydroxy-phenyl)propionate/3-hydroxycinnamic acid hydroxylase [Paracoccus sp. (in: a-proteobacteria)]